MGLALSRPHARQIIRHGHIEVNGRKVDVSSFLVKPGHVIKLRSSLSKVPGLRDEIDHPTFLMPNYLVVDKEKLEIQVIRRPERDEVLLEIKEDLIIEFYSRVA